MNIKNELQEILKQIDANTTYAWKDDLDDTAQVSVREDFDRRVQGETYPSEEEMFIAYNGWYERLKQLTEIL